MTAIRINDKVDLHYSADDHGWYFQEYDAKFHDRVSQLFETESFARKAWDESRIRWHKL